jgi:hypothetical protein
MSSTPPIFIKIYKYSRTLHGYLLYRAPPTFIKKYVKDAEIQPTSQFPLCYCQKIIG